MKRIGFIASCWLLILCWGCNSKHQQEDHTKAFISLYTRFISSSVSVKAEASIRVGDSLANSKHVEFPNGISFHGTPMSKKELPNSLIRYSHSLEGKPGNPLVFRFVDIENNDQEVFTSLEGPASYAFSNDILDLTSPNTLSWDGADLAADEEIIIIFTDAKGKSMISKIEGPTSSSEAIVPVNELEALQAAPISAYIVKKKVERRKIGCNILEIISEYYSESSSIGLRHAR